MRFLQHRGHRFAAIASIAVLSLVAGTVTVPAAAAEPAPQVTSATGGGHDHGTDPVLMFAADGMRQDIVERYAKERNGVPGFAELLKKGAAASGNGMLTQAPPNTGAGWYTMATGAWPGVTGSTNNTFHINTQPLANRTAAFDPGVLQAETIAQSAERGGKKVIQLEWAGGRNGAINGPTVDFRTFHSGRGVTTNFVTPSDRENLIASFGLQFDHPGGFAGQAPFPQAAPTPATGWTGAPRSYSPALEIRMRVLDFGVDKYGLDAYIYDSRNDNRLNYDRVLFARNKNAAEPVANLRQGQLADVKVTVIGGALEWPDCRHADQGRGPQRTTPPRFGYFIPRSAEPTPAGPVSPDRTASPTSRSTWHRSTRPPPPATSPCWRPGW